MSFPLVMAFPLVFINVFLMFAVAGAVACWGFALIPIWRAKMRTMTSIPVILGLTVALYYLWMGESAITALVALAAVSFLSSMFLAFVYGWTKKHQFDSADVAAGIGSFGPVMLIWTCCLLFTAVITLVNTATTGSAIPFRYPFGVAVSG